MSPLDTLLAEARSLATGARAEPVAEVTRQMQICNACRYCESFCGVFSAMTRRLTFGEADVHYLANLCHNCGACLHACQYAPPHDFAVNVPRAMAEVRLKTYTRYAWPSGFAKLYERNGLTVALALAVSLALVISVAMARHGSLWGSVAAGNFYAVLPHGLLVSMFGPIFLFAMLALGIGVWRFMRDIGPATGSVKSSVTSQSAAVRDALRLKYLDGGHGEGCHNADDAWTHARRRAHHLTFYGFMLCFAATSVATVYHYVFQWSAPYAWTSLPKLLGISGGVSMVIGTLWLARLRSTRHLLHGDPAQSAMDTGFIALLFLTAATGLLLMVLRTTAAMPLTLAIHLSVVMALFLTMPYGKFAHGFYRLAALVRHHVERRLPNRLGLSSD